MAEKLITPKAILSYPHLFEAAPKPNSTELVYSCCLIFPKGTDLSAMKKAAEAAAKEKFGDKLPTLIKAGKFRWPFRTDTEDKGYPDEATFFNCSSKQKPGVVQPFAGADGKPALVEKEEDVYAGCFVRASVAFFGYDTQGNKGVAVGLNNVQKLAEGERLDGRSNARNDFDVVAEEAMTDAMSIL